MVRCGGLPPTLSLQEPDRLSVSHSQVTLVIVLHLELPWNRADYTMYELEI